MVHITTDRLYLRDWHPGDLPLFQALNRDPEVMEFFPKPLSSEESDDLYRKILHEHETRGYGLYAVEHREIGEYIGFIGFHMADFPSAFTPAVEIGWRLDKQFWGRGLATEGAKACLEYGFQELGFPEVISFTSKRNTRSQRVMEKIGLRFDREFDHPDIDPEHPLCRHVLYRKSSQ